MHSAGRRVFKGMANERTELDSRLNRRQSSGVIELSEQTVIDQLVARLTSRYPTISESTVESVVRDVHARYDDRPLRDFVPLFVERHARAELERYTSRTVSAGEPDRGGRAR